MRGELGLRILSAIVLAAIVLSATWLGGIVFRFVAVAIALLVYYEWSTMTRLAEADFRANALGWLAVVIVGGLVLLGDLESAFVTLGVAALVALVYVAVVRSGGWLAGGIVYAGLTGLSLAAIRGADTSGLIAMLFVFAVVWATDILAYFVGRAIGGPKLAPRISPGKTWSGAIGGTISAVVAGMAVYLVYFPMKTLWVPAIALVLSVFSQVGDLFESFIKRRFGVKDSSHLIPGHGGVMDRVDGLVFACFAAFLMGLAYALFTGRTVVSTAAFLLGL